jgi:hypothetical protein
MDYPDRKYVLGSKFPDIWLHYRKGLRSIGGSDVDFDRISLAVSKNEITMGTWGAMRFRFEAGKFLNASKLYFQDWRHFLGNETRIGNKDYYMNAFKMLPYYAYSTSDVWLQGNWEHDFRGKFTDKIPGLKKLGWNLVAGANFLYTSEAKDYAEVSLGFDGLTTLRLFRVDVVASFERGKYQGIGYIVGMSLPLEELQL